MGVAVSNWQLARACRSLGQLGVVSGTALAVVLSRRLQLGDPGGHMRRALEHLPVPAVARRVLADHFVPGGKRRRGAVPRTSRCPACSRARALEELTVAANFVEVFLAKQGHGGVGRHQSAGEDPVPHAAVAVRRDAGGRGLRADGRGHPADDSRRARPLGRRRAGGTEDRRRRRPPPARSSCPRFDPRAFCGGRGRAPAAAAFPGHRRLGDAGDDAGAQGQRRVSTASSSKAPRPAATTRRRAARCS